MRNFRWVAIAVIAAVIVTTPVFGAAAKSDYQVTGNVVEVNNDMIVVMKGKERFEIGRDASSKIPADVKVGDKVTIYYKMTATNFEAKGAAKAKPAKAEKKTKKAA